MKKDKIPKIRLDDLLVGRGLAENRDQARALILSGTILVGDRPADKAGTAIPADAEIRIRGEACPYVSRGGVKLRGALDAFGISAAGLTALDVGASTGGFTDCLLQRGARRVIALDVGYGQIAQQLRDDARVTVLERVNARELRELPFAPELIVCDVSFISLRLVLPPALELAAPGWQAVALVKPQFEAGRKEVGRGGVIRDLEVRRRVVRQIAEASLAWHARVAGVVDSGLPGPKGNREVFIHLIHEPAREPALPAQLDEWIADAVR